MTGGQDIALSDVESMNVSLSAPVYSFGFEFVEPSCTNLLHEVTNLCDDGELGANVKNASIIDSTFTVTLKNAGNIIRHSLYRRRDGVRRRYRCKTCGKTFSANTSTIYQGLHCSRDEFDRVAQLSVEVVNKSAISRVSGRSWSTIARWLALASEA